MMIIMKILDIGYGKAKFSGSIGVDISNKTDADVIHDLNVFPYPFDDNTFDSIFCDNVLERLDDIIRTIGEI
jgi:predicted SAM-dependent methyltransferase